MSFYDASSQEKSVPSYRKTILTFFILALVFGIASLLYPILLPFAAAYTAVLFLLENPKKRRLSYICVAAFAACEIVIAVWGGGFGCYTPLIIFPAILLVFAFHRKWNRRDTAVLSVSLITVLLLLSSYFDGAGYAGSYHPKEVFLYYGDLLDRAEETFVQSMLTALQENPALKQGDTSVLTEESLRSFVSSLKNYVFAVLVWGAMIFACLSTRVFAKAVGKTTGIGMHPFFTDFLMTSLTAYLFLALSCVAYFSSSASWTLVVNYLCLILTLPFAYIGAKGMWSILSRSHRTFLKFLMVAAIVIFSVYAVRLLAYFGAFANIMFNRAIRESQDRTE